MTWREMLGRLVAWRRRDALERELDADLQAHLDLLVRDHEASGMSPAEARQARGGRWATSPFCGKTAEATGDSRSSKRCGVICGMPCAGLCVRRVSHSVP